MPCHQSLSANLIHGSLPCYPRFSCNLFFHLKISNTSTFLYKGKSEYHFISTTNSVTKLIFKTTKKCGNQYLNLSYNQENPPSLKNELLKIVSFKCPYSGPIVVLKNVSFVKYRQQFLHRTVKKKQTNRAG